MAIFDGRAEGKRKDIPDGLWVKCVQCNEIIYNGELNRNLRICPKCDYYFPLLPLDRINMLADKGSFAPYHLEESAASPGKEVGDWAVVVGEARVSRHRVAVAAVNFDFTDHHIGFFVCEKIVAAAKSAIQDHLPLLIVYSGGIGLRAQDETLFPAQTLSMSSVVSKLESEKLPYISLLALSNAQDRFPGFAYLADIVLVEACSLNDTQAARQKKSDQMRIAEAAQELLNNGMIDAIVARRETSEVLRRVLNFVC